jgi:group I intron endonuclease
MHIYKFTHIDTGRAYVGQTTQDPNRRRLEHVCHSNHSPKSYHFHNALNLYGIDAFTFEVIAEATSVEELNSLEIKFIEQFDSITNGFNIREGGGNKTHNPESIERMREAQRAAHARRRAEGGGVEKTKPRVQTVRSWKWTDEQKQKFKEMLEQKKQGASV